jgi:hypothetical protein
LRQKNAAHRITHQSSLKGLLEGFHGGGLDPQSQHLNTMTWIWQSMAENLARRFLLQSDWLRISDRDSSSIVTVSVTVPIAGTAFTPLKTKRSSSAAF